MVMVVPTPDSQCVQVCNSGLESDGSRKSIWMVFRLLMERYHDGDMRGGIWLLVTALNDGTLQGKMRREGWNLQVKESWFWSDMFWEGMTVTVLVKGKGCNEVKQIRD
jgi:hypothetical protein